MYRCVQVSHPGDYRQCILWRENDTDEIKTYKLNTVTYDTKPAAFLAIRAMHQLAIDEEENFPLVSKVVPRDFYVDDMLSGGNTIAEVEEIRHQVAALLKKGEFLFRKWCSNDPHALRDVPTEDCKTFGLTWDPQSDNFIFSFTPIDDCKVVTKQSILSSIASLYDPLGLIGPVITKAKMFMEHLWKLNLQWDESLLQSLYSSWIKYISKFDLTHRFTFPRHISMTSSVLQIHGFCDASLASYGACVYVRSQLNNVIKCEL
uniref:Reverse transcriptase domain-containing protein n=1 Tax=Stomoxys calcitrans TaxID=35570 RepID=A0A1I8NTT6_STOCA